MASWGEAPIPEPGENPEGKRFYTKKNGELGVDYRVPLSFYPNEKKRTLKYYSFKVTSGSIYIKSESKEIALDFVKKNVPGAMNMFFFKTINEEDEHIFQEIIRVKCRVCNKTKEIIKDDSVGSVCCDKQMNNDNGLWIPKEK